jgi:hypothetical protein
MWQAAKNAWGTLTGLTGKYMLSARQQQPRLVGRSLRFLEVSLGSKRVQLADQFQGYGTGNHSKPERQRLAIKLFIQVAAAGISG